MLFKKRKKLEQEAKNPENCYYKNSRCKPLDVLIRKFQKIKLYLKDHFPKRVWPTKQENRKGSKF